jgi:hypothetical protein
VLTNQKGAVFGTVLPSGGTGDECGFYRADDCVEAAGGKKRAPLGFRQSK